MSYITGYARISTEDQTLDAQFDAIEGAGTQKQFQEKSTDTKRDRPSLCSGHRIVSGARGAGISESILP